MMPKISTTLILDQLIADALALPVIVVETCPPGTIYFVTKGKIQGTIEGLPE